MSVNGTDTGSMKINPGNYRRGPAEARELSEAARKFEAVLIGQFFKLMHSTVVRRGALDKSFQRGMYEEMLQTEFARSFSRRGGFGLHRQMVERLDNLTEGKAGEGMKDKEADNSFQKIESNESIRISPRSKPLQIEKPTGGRLNIDPANEIIQRGAGESEE